MSIQGLPSDQAASNTHDKISATRIKRVSFVVFLGVVTSIMVQFAPLWPSSLEQGTKKTKSRPATTLVLGNRQVVEPFINAQYANQTDATIVAGIKGGVGNVLLYVGHAYGLHLVAKMAYGLKTNIVLHANAGLGGRHKEGVDSLRQCWPQFRSWTLLDENDVDLKKFKQIQQDWAAPNASILTSSNMANIAPSLRYMRFLLNRTNVTSPSIPENYDGPIKLPFMTTLSMGISGGYIDHFGEIRSGLLRFDQSQPGCCPPILPSEDETIFHFRNFATELSHKKSLLERYLDLSPDVAANELLGHLQAGDRVVLVTRIMQGRRNKAVYDMVNALESRGLSVQLTYNHTAMEDLCYLINAKKELIGTKKSTFFRFAAAASDASQVLFYTAVREANTTCTPIGHIPCETFVVPRNPA